MATYLRRLGESRSVPLGVLGGGLVLAAAAGTLLSPVMGKAATTQHGSLYLWIAVVLAAAVIWYTFLGYAAVGDFPIRWVPFPVTIVIIVDSLLSTHGVHASGTTAHQAGWAVLGVAFGYAAVVRRRFPGWLIAYAGLGVALQLAVSFRFRVVPDLGLSAVALLVMWLVALALRRDGGVMHFVRIVAIGYWIVTILALIVYVTHVSIGKMAPSTVEMPWQGGLRNVLTTGNVTGYGFVSGQAGREASFVVCLYHLIAWRFGRKRGQLWLGGLAFLLFVTGYGRVAIVGGAIGLAIVLLTNAEGTRAWRLGVAAVLAIALVTIGGFGSKLLNLSARSGTAQSAAGGSSGHLALWSQQLNLFLQDPLTGVGSNATIEQSTRARFSPLFRDPAPPTISRLNADGSRGEGGWTGLVAQRGVINGGALLALIAAALAYCFSRFPVSREGQQDMTLVRATIAGSLMFYLTDAVPFSIYTLTSYVLGQITMIAAVRAIDLRRARREGAVHLREGDSRWPSAA